MALTVSVTKENKQASEWCDYKDEDGNVLARFKVRGIAYKPYQVSIERVQAYIGAIGHNPESVTPDAKYGHEYLNEAMAHHLIADWEDIELSFDDGKTFQRVEYTPENAIKLLQTKDIGLLIWYFVKTNSERIQKEADQERDEVLGKSGSSMNIQNSKTPKTLKTPRARATR